MSQKTLSIKELQEKVRALSKAELLIQARTLVAEERRIQAEFLVYLERIEAVGLHLEMAYSSLHEFMTRELGFSEGAAQRRIQALFLMKAIPETKAAIESGNLSLSVASTLQTFFRSEAKLQDKRYRPEEKRELFNAVQGMSRRESEKYLATISAQSMLPQEKLRAVSETKSQLTIVVDSEVGELLDRLLGLLAHQRPAPQSYGDLVSYLARMGVERHDPLLKKTGVKRLNSWAAERAPIFEVAATPPAEPISNGNVRHLSAELKRSLWTRDQGRCTWVDKASVRRCESRHALEADHRVPFAQGGETSLSNLRLLCLIIDLSLCEYLESRK